MASILIIDDDRAFREALAETLASLGHSTTEVASGIEALRSLERETYDAAFLDFRMPDMDGLEVLEALRKRSPTMPPVVVLTAYSSSDNTIQAMRLGAFDHLAKPVGRDDISKVLARVLRDQAGTAARRPGASSEDQLVGLSDAMREVQKQLGRAAASDATVLISGETGTGKEMVARALHKHSARSQAPFVAVNCAAIPKDLLESELFGHVRGAFTGATADRPGCFRAAEGGVLLLDEIGDMAMPVQAKLLRVLQESEVTPLGSHRAVKINVRVVAATHRDLAAAVAAEQFREDLLYRLDVLRIELPPLRERTVDILPLAEQFLRAAAKGQAPKRLSADAERRLISHSWPGNVRELRNVMERCHAMVRHQVIDASDLVTLGLRVQAAASAESASAPAASGLVDAVERPERQMIADHADVMNVTG